MAARLEQFLSAKISDRAENEILARFESVGLAPSQKNNVRISQSSLDGLVIFFADGIVIAEKTIGLYECELIHNHQMGDLPEFWAILLEDYFFETLD